MDKNYKNFIQAIHEIKMVKIDFISKSKWEILRECIPLDFGKSENIKKDQLNRYFVFDLDSGHPLPILPEQIVYIEIINKKFNPADYVDLTKHKWWIIKRDWWIYS